MVLINLLNKLDENSIDDSDVIARIEELISYLKSVHEGNNSSRKKYNKAFNELKQNIQKKYGFVAKGTYASMYLFLGIIIGSGIGSALIAVNPIFISLGTGIGISIGVVIGSEMEKKAEKEGKIY